MKILKTFILVIFAKIANAQSDATVNVRVKEYTATDKSTKTLTTGSKEVEFKFTTNAIANVV